MIGSLPRFTVNRGQEISIPIPITGLVGELEIHGPWIGLNYRLTDTGGEMYGTINANSVFTTREFSYSVTAYNEESFDTATLILEIAVGG